MQKINKFSGMSKWCIICFIACLIGHLYAKLIVDGVSYESSLIILFIIIYATALFFSFWIPWFIEEIINSKKILLIFFITGSIISFFWSLALTGLIYQ